MSIPQQKHIDNFLEYLSFQKRLSRHTLIAYQNDLLTCFTYLNAHYELEGIKDIKSTYIRSWLASLKEQNLGAATINRKISALKSFFKYQVKQQQVALSPMATIISPKKSKRLPQYVEADAMEKLFEGANFSPDFTGQTEKLIIEILYQTGIRKAELIGLKITQIDFYTNSIRVLGKGSKERIIPVSNQLLNTIKEYIIARSKNFENLHEKNLFLSAKGKKLDPKAVYNLVKKHLSSVTTLQKKSPHILRHSFATQLTNNGAELNAVKELLGHSSLAATQIYTHNSIQKLKDVFNKAHPKA